jgi:hypothetical protein
MKTALLSSSVAAESVVASSVVAAESVVAESVVAVDATSVASSDHDANILDKISRDCSSDELKYLMGLSTLEQRVCHIAQDHLESSFDLVRSSGFIAWKKSSGTT